MTKTKAQRDREAAATPNPAPERVPVSVMHMLTHDDLVLLLSAWHVDVGYQTFDPLTGEEAIEAVRHQLREVGPPDWNWGERAGLDPSAERRIDRWAAAQVRRHWPSLETSP